MVSSAKSKGGAGAILEHYFGIVPNTAQRPDFEAAGVELKVCPLVMDGERPRRVKERTSVTMIDFMALEHETWETASVRAKIAKVLFVFYEWRPDTPIEEFRVRAVRLWSPPARLLPFMKRDWLVVWRKNHEGKAELISESDGLILGAATKGATGGTRPQPNSPIPAPSRAWSLKPSLTGVIFSQTQGDDTEDALVARLGAEGADPVDALLGGLELLVGRTVRGVATERGVKVSTSAKDRAQTAMRLALGLRARVLPTELEALGLELKFVPVGPHAEPFEAMSFPAFDPRELAGEEWEDSDMLRRVQNMLIVPLYRERRKRDLLEQQVCRPFRWAAQREELATMRHEWEEYRERVAAGRADAPLRESETRILHVRPHGRDGADRVQAPGGVEVARMCFWLNREFVRELVLAHHADWMGF
jgi:DNA mismatch repair endonuclease MutH